jgi:hypothetical protein
MQTQHTAASPAVQAIPAESIEHVKVTRKLARDLRIASLTLIPLDELNLHHIIEVSKVGPCPGCGAPVCVVEFSDRPGTRVVDAVPDDGWKVWTADLLRKHACEVFQMFGTTALRQVLNTTMLRGTLVLGPILEVQHPQICNHCGGLIAAVKFDHDYPEWYDCSAQGLSAEAYLDRQPRIRYFARLTHFHHCLEPQKEVRQ